MPEGRRRSTTKSIRNLVPQILALNDPFQEVRSHIGALTYQIEVTHSESCKNSLRKEIAGSEGASRHNVPLPGRADKQDDDLRPDGAAASGVEGEKGGAAAEARGRDEAGDRAARRSATNICPTASPTSSADTIAGVQRKLENFDIHIRQIHVKDVDLVDRCESCHLGTREPVDAHQGGDGRRSGLHQPSEQGAAENPRSGEVRLHALPRRQRRRRGSSVEKAHGHNKFWLWPMHHKENVEAGCQQCHCKEIVTEMADTLNAGPRDLPAARLHGLPSLRRLRPRCRTRCRGVNQQIRQLEQQKAEWMREAGFSHPEGRQDPRQQGSAEALRARQRSEGAGQRSRRQDRAARHALARA